MKNNKISLVVVLIGLGFAQPCVAVGTIAGTDIDNTAVVSYEVAGTPQSITSDTVTLTVAEVLDVDVTLLSGPVSVVSGASTQELLFVVTNTGNGTETFLLAINNALSGDDFDPVASIPAAIYSGEITSTRPSGWLGSEARACLARSSCGFPMESVLQRRLTRLFLFLIEPKAAIVAI